MEKTPAPDREKRLLDMKEAGLGRPNKVCISQTKQAKRTLNSGHNVAEHAGEHHGRRFLGRIARSRGPVQKRMRWRYFLG